MTVASKHWEFSAAEQQKFDAWVERINTGHTGTSHMRNETLHWTPVTKPLSECVVNLFTTGGVHLKSDRPFDVANPHGDRSFREIPTDVTTSELAITHTHYNHVDADRDINCMFPLDRLRELRDQGVIGSIAPVAYTVMGFNPNPVPLVEETVPELARRIKAGGADLLFMTCGWPICHRSVGLVQNVVEGLGVSTISMSVQPHITAATGVPRGMFLRFPAGNQVGEAGKPQQQRAILTAALEAMRDIQSPGTIVELPYRWRRFPIQEEPVFTGTSQGPRHSQAEAIGDALDTVVHAAQVYKAYMESRLAQEEANATPMPGLAAAYRLQIGRLDHFIASLDGDILDQLRDIVNAVAVMELRAAGKFV